MTAHARYSAFTAISSFLKSLCYAEPALNKVAAGMTKGEWTPHSSVKKKNGYAFYNPFLSPFLPQWESTPYVSDSIYG